MALEDILEAIRAETDAQISAIEQEAAERAAIIIGEGQRAATIVEAELADARLAEAAAAADRLCNRARLESDRRLRAAREQIVQQVFDDVKKRLHSVRQSGEYPAVFESLAAEAAGVLAGAARARVDPRDEGSARAVLGSRIEVTADLDTAGGLVLESDDGRRVDNTLEVRFQRAAPFMRQLIAEAVPELGERPA